MTTNQHDTVIARAAVAYADAVTNNDGYGIAAQYAAYALADMVDDSMNRTEAAKVVAEAATLALASRNGGKRANVGANKVTQLALAFEATLNAGFSADDTALAGAVYRARVGKTEGGSKRIDRILSEHSNPAEALAAVESAARTASKPSTGPTVETVSRTLDKWADVEWSAEDRAALARLFLSASETFGAATTAD